jgi:hypothetical protein
MGVTTGDSVPVALNERSVKALDRVRAETGLSVTDAINRSLQLYALVLDTPPGTWVAVDNPGWPDLCIRRMGASADRRRLSARHWVTAVLIGLASGTFVTALSTGLGLRHTWFPGGVLAFCLTTSNMLWFFGRRR